MSDLNLNLNHTQFAHAQDIVAAVRQRGLSRRHAVIAIETALTESRLRMYANRNNPASLALPHEAVGSDHGSVGLFQQQVGGAKHSTANWGTTAQLMNAAVSTRKFLDALVKHDISGRTNWQAAQSVQHSAFSDGRNYRANDAEAQRIVAELWDDVEVPDSDQGGSGGDHGDGGSAAKVVSVPTGSGGSVDYVVHAGDTLFAIAARFGTTWRELADLNQLANPDLILPGQHLHVSASSGSPASSSLVTPPAQTSGNSTTYTVRPGDSLFAIAQRFGTTWQHLAQVNHLPDPDLIHPGQKLTVS